MSCGTQRGRIAKPAPRAGKVLQRRRRDADVAETRAVLGSQEIDERVDVGRGKHAQEFREHAFAAAPAVEPVVDEGDAHLPPL